MRASWLVLLASLAGCTCQRSQPAGDPPEAGASTAKSVDADAGPPIWPSGELTIAFDRAAAYVTFQNATEALLVDLRNGAHMRNTRAFAAGDVWFTYGLPMENNVTHYSLETFGAGRFGEHEGAWRFEADGGRTELRSHQLEELASGRLLPGYDDVLEPFALEQLPNGNRLHRFDGTVLEQPSGLVFDRDAVLYSGPLSVDGGEVLRVVDPIDGRSADLAATKTRSVGWLTSDHRALLVRAEDQPFELLSVFEWPSGKLLAQARPRGTILDLQVEKAGGVVAWTELRGEPPAKCAAAALTIADRHTMYSASMPCRQEEDEQPIRLFRLEPNALTLQLANEVRLDVHSGARLPPAPRAQGNLTPLEHGAFVEEEKRVLRERPELRDLSPLLLDAAILEAKYGYDVIEFGNAATVLVAKGDTFSLCSAARGDACRPLLTCASSVKTAGFSADGSSVAIAFDDRIFLADGKSGERLLESAIRPAPVLDAGPSPRK